MMNGSGCKNCPVLAKDTVCDCNYRGHFCLSRRAELGLGDPITIADRIRAMSDEELATAAFRLAHDYDKPLSKQDMLARLQRPAEEVT